MYIVLSLSDEGLKLQNPARGLQVFTEAAGEELFSDLFVSESRSVLEGTEGHHVPAARVYSGGCATSLSIQVPASSDTSTARSPLRQKFEGRGAVKKEKKKKVAHFL